MIPANTMSNLPMINKLTSIYHRNKNNIRIEFSKIRIVEYLCFHRQNMPIEIIHLSKYQNESYLIFQLQANESIITFIISCRLKLIFEIYYYSNKLPKQNKVVVINYFR